MQHYPKCLYKVQALKIVLHSPVEFVVFQTRFIDIMVFYTVFNVISFIMWQPVHLSMFSWSSLLSILSESLAAFQHNHSWERNDSCWNDYHQSLERILAEPWIRTCDLLFSSPLCYWLSYRARLLDFEFLLTIKQPFASRDWFFLWQYFLVFQTQHSLSKPYWIFHVVVFYQHFTT